METLQYTTIDKTNWLRGPWDNEPDKKQWRDVTTGLACLIVRSHITGALCGYVGVPLGHPAFGKHYDAVNVRVHGGLTFSGLCHKREDESHGICHIGGEKVWWLGFDCAHCDDQSPAMDAKLRELGAGSLGMRDHRACYRDMAYITNEIEELAGQLNLMRASNSWLWYLRNALLYPVTWVRDTRVAQRTRRKVMMWKMKRALPGLQKLIVDLRASSERKRMEEMRQEVVILSSDLSEGRMRQLEADRAGLR